ncbi:MAG: T9SS type A sorting domain-containing protein [Bacteroidales bacterium]|nr:T9SS type A sorting domain-containing protein [Bacteroidales bacterium]
MKKFATILSACLFLIMFSNVLAQENENGNYLYFDENQNIQGALDYYKLVRGTPDVKDVLKANQQADKLSKRKAITWTEVGPENITGRSRAFLIDNKNSSTMYIGSAFGGLWKSTTGGTSWHQLPLLSNSMNVSCITQDAAGNIYYGTGEGFVGLKGDANGYSSFVGGGIYKSTDGENFEVLASTVPASNTDKWAFIYRLATSGSRIYAATNGGLRISDDGGATWVNGVSYVEKTATDIEVASNGYVYAVVDNKVYFSENGDAGSFVSRQITGIGSNVGRIELSVAPSDPNYIYASAADKNGEFLGVYRSTDAAITWEKIGPGGSLSFNILGGNGIWANTIKVFPNDKDKVLVGGKDLWLWKLGNTWEQKSMSELSEYSPLFLHIDHHDIVFKPNDPSTFYHVSSGGLSKSTDGGNTFSTVNRLLSTAQINAVTSNAFGKVFAGAIDAGSFIIPGTFLSSGTAIGITRGSACGVAMSYINPDVAVVAAKYGNLLRSFEGGENMSPFYATDIIYQPSPTFSAFNTPIYLDEQLNDVLTTDSMYYFATDTLSAGDVITVISKENNKYPFYVTIPNDMLPGDSIFIQNKVQARFYIGLNGSLRMTRGIHNFSGTPKWHTLASFLGSVHSIAGSSDGNYLFFGTDNGEVYRLENLCLLQDTTSDIITLVNPTLITAVTGVITSISVDPSDVNNVLITVGGYDAVPHVLLSNNALSATPTFSDKMGNLPNMPVYSSCIVAFNESNVLVGTDLGVFKTLDINAASPEWIEENEAFGRIPVFSIFQQSKNYPGSTNYGKIYIGTHGRGIFESSEYVGLNDCSNMQNNSDNSLFVFPNPVENEAVIRLVNNNYEKATLNIYSIDGKLVLNKKIELISGINNINVNLQEIASGNYIVEIRSNAANYSSKIIKK